jgi:hypothetical protein
MQIAQNIAKMGKSTLLGVLVIVVIQSMLTGCATTAGKKSSGVVTSREATEIWHSYEILPDYNYYYSGPESQPNFLIGIDDRYKLMTEFWKPVDLTSAMLKNWFNYIDPRVGYSPFLWGALITGPNGERIGLWYSVRDWRRLGSAYLGENNKVTVTTPSVTDPRKRLFFYNRHDE